MYDFYYVNVKRVNHHSSFASLKSGMVHYKNRIGLNGIITKRGKNGMVDYKNHLSIDMITKRGKNGIKHYVY